MSFPVVADSVSQEGEKKSGLVNYEVEPGFSTRMRQNFYPTMNPKKLKRLISNRISAKNTRWKKQQHIEDLEKKSIKLDTHVTLLRYQLKMASEQKQYLLREQTELKECVAVGLQRSIIDEGEIVANRAEIERLKKKVALLN